MGGQTYFGSGCLISSRIVLTCAHNIYDRESKKEGKKLEFTLEINGKKYGQKVKVIKYFYPKEYIEKGLEEASKYDYGVLQLEDSLEDAYGYIGIDTSNENKRANEI